MTTLTELLTKWAARREEWKTLGVTVSGERVAEEILNDVRAVNQAAVEQLMTPTEAAKETGYHPESIARLARRGNVPNYGKPHRPLVRLADLPRKAKAHTASGSKRASGRNRQPVASSAVVGNIDGAAIARDAVAGRIGRT